MATRPLATSINAIASTGAGIILGVISFKFFSWFRTSNTKNNAFGIWDLFKVQLSKDSQIRSGLPNHN